VEEEAPFSSASSVAAAAALAAVAVVTVASVIDGVDAIEAAPVVVGADVEDGEGASADGVVVVVAKAYAERERHSAVNRCLRQRATDRVAASAVAVFLVPFVGFVVDEVDKAVADVARRPPLGHPIFPPATAAAPTVASALAAGVEDAVAVVAAVADASHAAAGTVAARWKKEIRVEFHF